MIVKHEKSYYFLSFKILLFLRKWIEKEKNSDFKLTRNFSCSFVPDSPFKSEDRHIDERTIVRIDKNRLVHLNVRAFNEFNSRIVHTLYKFVKVQYFL